MLLVGRAASIDEEQCVETELRLSDEPLETSNGSGGGGDGSDSDSDSSAGSAGVSGGFGIDNKQLAALGELSSEECYTAGIICSIQARGCPICMSAARGFPTPLFLKPWNLLVGYVRTPNCAR